MTEPWAILTIIAFYLLVRIIGWLALGAVGCTLGWLMLRRT